MRFLEHMANLLSRALPKRQTSSQAHEEINKAQWDATYKGSGWLHISADGQIRAVPPEMVYVVIPGEVKYDSSIPVAKGKVL